jgi:hypothetical protein
MKRMIMATAVKKKATTKKSALKKPKKATTKKSAGTTKNKLGVKNSLVNNINARKKKGITRKKKETTVSRDSYKKMEEHWYED